jgi:membrane protein YqaA with SNARE-associated domain
MNEFEHLLGLVDPFVRQYGLIAVPIIITLESLGAPLPRESLLIFGSVMAEHGNMSFPLLLLFAWIGGVIGDNIGYFIGKKLGRVVLLRYGGKIGITPKRLSQVEVVFARYGPLTVAFARFFQRSSPTQRRRGRDLGDGLVAISAFQCNRVRALGGHMGAYRLLPRRTCLEHHQNCPRLRTVGSNHYRRLGAIIYASRRERTGDS